MIKKTENYIQQQLAGDSSGHDWWHIYRVRELALHIGNEEKADLFIVELAALLHDIGDWKFHGTEKGPEIATAWLGSLGARTDIINHVSSIIAELSFKGAGVRAAMSSLEGMVVQDADRLDAIGAIGIARCFAFGGSRQREIYNQDIKPVMHQSYEAYKASKGTTINHFYEKLLLLKDRMNTAAGKRLAASRHAFMEQYLARFMSEWSGKE